MARCINPITERQYYVVSDGYEFEETQVQEFYKKFRASLPTVLCGFARPKNVHALAEEFFLDRATITVVRGIQNQPNRST